MPISDSAIFLWNAAPADGAQAGVHVGKGPIGGMLLRMKANGDAATTVSVQESDDDSTYYTLPLGNAGASLAFLAGEYAEQRIWWSKPYLRVTFATSSGTGVFNVGLIQGEIPEPMVGPAV